MRASTDQIRSATHDVVDVARNRAAGLVETGADLVSTAVDRGSSVVEGGLEKVAEKAPMVSVNVKPRPRRHRIRTVLIAAVVLGVILAVAKKLTGQIQPEPGPSEPDTSFDETTVRGTEGEGEGSIPAGAA